MSFSNQIKYIGICVLLIVVSFGCSSKRTDEEMRDEEQEKIDKKMKGPMLNLYKGVKIGIRSITTDQTNPPQGVDLSELKEVRTMAAQLIVTSTDTSKELGVMDYLKIMKDLSSLNDFVNRTDEDLFPTILEVTDGVTKTKLSSILSWNNTKEHLALYVLLEGSRVLPASFPLYEITKSNPDELSNDELKILTYLAQSIAYLRLKSPYLSEHNCTKSMTLLDADQITFQSNSEFKFFEGAQLPAKEANRLEYHAVSALMRAVSRFSMDDEDKNELAYDDLELFMKDVEKLGVENELTWIVGSVVYTKKGDKEKALYNLTELRNSPLLSESEVKEMDKIIEYVNSRNSDQALVSLTDNIFMARIVFSYTYAQVKKTSWYKDAMNSESGKLFTEWPDKMGKEVEKVEKYGAGGISVDIF